MEGMMARLHAEATVRDAEEARVRLVRDAERERILAQLPALARWRPDTPAERRERTAERNVRKMRARLCSYGPPPPYPGPPCDGPCDGPCGAV